MYQLFEIGTCLCECVLLHIFYQSWFGRRERSGAAFWGCYLLYFAFSCLYTLADILPLLRSGFSLACVFLIAWYLYRTSARTAALGSILFIALGVLAEYIVLAILSVSGVGISQIQEYGPQRALYIGAAKVVNLVVVLISTTILGKDEALLSPRQIISILPCQVISVYACHVFYTMAQQNDLQTVSYVLVLLGLLYINFTLVILIRNLERSARVQQQQALAEQNFALQQTYYAQIQQDQAETHALWHDIKKHVVAMQAMVESGTSSAAEELSHIESAFAQIGNLVDVGNTEINVILNYSIQRANAAGCHVCLRADVPEKSSVSPVDLSVIIGNTMDNAIEACQSLPDEQRTIDVVLCRRNHMLFYIVENEYVEDAIKPAKRVHGYGLKNVQKCIEKYSGSMDVCREDGKFTASIRLNEEL